MTTYYKAIRPDGGSFNDPSFVWATDPGGVTTHTMYRRRGRGESTAAGYLSVATVPTDCTGMRWPCRLLEVEPIGRLWTPDKDQLPNKRAGLRFRTVREIDAHEALGPQGVHVAALIERARLLTGEEASRLRAARNAAWYAARDATWDATWALIVRDLIGQHGFTQAHYDLLTGPWRQVIGPVHPDDAGVK